MKHSLSAQNRKGFTLVELLVVITIIAILAAISYAGLTTAIKRSKEMKAKAMASAVEEAVKSFSDTYSRLPDLDGLSAPGGGDTDSGDGVELLRILKAQEGSSGTIENSRKIDFLELTESKSGLKRDGLFYQDSSSAVSGLYDPWGNPFIVVLNTDYEDILSFTFGGRSFDLRGRDVAVFSAGADKEPGTKDDIKNFE